MTDGYITRATAAEMLDVSPRTVTTYILRGKLKGTFRLGQAWAIPKKAVEELKEGRPEGGFKRGRKKSSNFILECEEEAGEARPLQHPKLQA